MAVQVSYPGVYIDEFTPSAPIEGAGTSTAGFVGVALRGPINVPTLVQSWDAYQAEFGGFIDTPPAGYLATAVWGFFLNGGTACYVLRVGTGVHASAALPNRGATPGAVIDADATDEGAQGNALKVEVADASVVEALLKKAGSVDKVLKAAFATTKIKTAPTVAAPDTAELNSVKDFVTGDRVQLGTGAGAKILLIKSIDDVANTLTFGTPVPPGAGTVGTDVFLANLAPGRKRFRVVVPAKFLLSEALPSGATIRIEQTTPPLKEIAVVDFAAGDTITLKNGLLNDYAHETLADVPGIGSLEFTVTVSGTGAIEEFANLGVNAAYPNYWRTAVQSNVVRLSAHEPPPVVDDLRPKVGVYTLALGAPDNRNAAWTAFEAAPEKTLDLFRPIDEIAIVAAPGSTAVKVQQAVRDHCEQMKDRFGILDGVHDPTALKTVTASLAALNLQFADVRSKSGYVALYYPWLTAPNPMTGGLEMLPPSGHLAGIYARTDQERGVHKAPANSNIRGVLGLEFKLTNDQQGPLNKAGINILRVFPANAQPVVWGARTTALDKNWQYINVRRLFIFLEESIQEGIDWALFEPNNLQLWQKLNRSITEFLTRVWRDGALFGAVPKEAFYVRIDEALNPPSDRALGRLTIEIGVKPVYPAEFIIVRIGIWQGGSEVSEA